MKLAKRMELFQPSSFHQDRPEGSIDFTLGSPDIPPEEKVIAAISEKAADPGNYHYGLKPLPALIKSIQDWYLRKYGVQLAQEELCLLQGSQEALVNLPLVFCDPQDGVLIPDPAYPIYAQAPGLAGAEVLYMPLKAENGYLVDFSAIPEEDRKKAKMMVVSYPNNPTGAVAPDAFYEELIRFGKENDILIVHDNAYSELVFDGREGKSFLSYPGAKDVGVELNSFSKIYGMAGARLGVLAGNAQAVQAYRRLKENIDYGVFLPIQYGAITALAQEPASIEETRDTYQRRRDLLVDLFGKAGWIIPKSEGTMFLWAPVPGDDAAFARKLAEKTGILVTPGSAFGPGGKGYVRIALIQDEDHIQEAARRLSEADLF